MFVDKRMAEARRECENIFIEDRVESEGRVASEEEVSLTWVEGFEESLAAGKVGLWGDR